MTDRYFRIISDSKIPDTKAFLIAIKQFYPCDDIYTSIGKWTLSYSPESEDIVSENLIPGVIGKFRRELKEIVSRTPISMKEFYFTAYRIRRFLGINITLELF